MVSPANVARVSGAEREESLSHSLTSPRGCDPAGFDDRDTDMFLCDTNTCKFDGECLRIGNMVTCICDFKVTPLSSSSSRSWLGVTLLLWLKLHSFPFVAQQWLKDS